MYLIYSMTGYGRGEGNVGGCTVSAEIRTVNQRFLECSCRMPRQLLPFEDKVKALLQSRLSRGKADLFVNVMNTSGEAADIEIDHMLAKGYVRAFKELADTYALTNNMTVSELAGMPDVLCVSRPEADENTVNALLAAVNAAVDSLLVMRAAEGERLRSDILSRAAFIRERVAVIEERSPQTVAEYRARLEAKIRELLSDTAIDEQRLLTETAIFADRIAVDEETVRLKSHLDQLEKLLQTGGAVGRKIDFLLQEINREINTVGSKAQDASLASVVVEVKAELEKIREQVQNIE